MSLPVAKKQLDDKPVYTKLQSILVSLSLLNSSKSLELLRQLILTSSPHSNQVLVSLLLVVFLYALDQLILSVAVPHILSEFGTLAQISWLTNGFFVSLAASVPGVFHLGLPIGEIC